MRRRRAPVGTRGPGLMGTMARTAVIAGTASATSNAVQRSAQQKQAAAQQAAAQQASERERVAQLQQQMADLQAQQLQSQLGPEPAAAPAGNDLLAQLERLAALQQAGALTPEEFSAAKAKLLGS